MTSFLLTLVRHGTPDAKRRIPKTVGNKDNSLSRKGYCQADLLGQRLKCEKFTHIYCSDITKAKETAVVIANQNGSCSSLPIHEDPRLEELRLLEEQKGVKNIDNSFLNKLETLEDIRHRAEDFFLEICDVMLHRTEQARSYDVEDDHCESSSRNSCDVDVVESPSKDPGNVLVVSHKGLIREMLRYFCSELGCHLPRRSGRRVNWDSSYTGVSVFRIRVERTDDLMNNIHVECLLLNDNSHLDEVLLMFLCRNPSQRNPRCQIGFVISWYAFSKLLVLYATLLVTVGTVMLHDGGNYFMVETLVAVTISAMFFF